jgi:hypothetical protein
VIRRPRRMLPAIVIALVVFAACAAVVVSLVQRLVGAHEFVSYDSVADELHGLTWTDAAVLIAGVVAVVLGAVLLVLAVLPGRAVVLPLTTEDGVRAGLTRAGLHSTLRRSAGTVDGVTSARIRLRRKAVKISARTDRGQSDGLAEQVCDTVTRRIQELGPEPVRRVRTAVRRSKKKSATTALETRTATTGAT